MSFSVFNNSSNLNNLNLVSSHCSPNPNFACELTAWIHPDHAFVDFNCGKINGTFGFYQRTNNQALNEVSIKGILNAVTGLKEGRDSSIINSGTLSFTSAISIRKRLVQEGLPNPWGLRPVIFKASSLNHRNNHLSGRIYQYVTGNFKRELRNFIEEGENSPGIVGNDDHYKTLCRNACHWSATPCIYSTLRTSEENVKKAYDYVNKVQQITFGKISKEEGKGLNGNYDLFNYNCIDFVRETMKRADPSLNWEDRMQYTNEPTFSQKILAVAWHYFRWRKGT